MSVVKVARAKIHRGNRIVAAQNRAIEKKGEQLPPMDRTIWGSVAKYWQQVPYRRVY
jgi:hypothetical protein